MFPCRPRSPYFWEEAPFLRPVLALIAGILLYEKLPAGSWRQLLPLLVPLQLTGFVLACIRRDPGPAVAALQRILIPVFFASLGLLACASRDPGARPGFSLAKPGGPTVVAIRSEPRRFGSGQSFVVTILQDAAGSRALQTGGRVVCYGDSSGAPQWREGDTLLLRGAWELIRPEGNPYEPDLAAAQRRKGIFFRMQARAADVSLLGRPAAGSGSWLRRMHEACRLRLERHIPDPSALGLIQAMLLGDEAGFDPGLRDLYADTGIIHIVSISGSHVAMLFAVIAGLLRWIPGTQGTWIRYGAGLLLVWLYVLVAGAPPSALRSAVMFSIVALSTLGRRESRGLNTLCMAALILLLAEPYWLYAPGFQLSFAAVLSLLLFYRPLLRLLPLRSGPLHWLWQAVCASLAAEILTAPIVIAYFHSFPLMFIPANIIAGLAIGAGGLIGGMLVILFSPLPLLASGTGTLLGRMLSLAHRVLAGLQHCSPEAFRHLYLSPPAFIMLTILIALLAIAWLRKNRTALLAGLAAGCALAAAGVFRAAEHLRQHRLIVYNNGRQALIDEIRGTCHRSLAAAGSGYRAAATRIALGAWRASADSAGTDYLAVGPDRVLILRDSSIRKPVGRLPADVLILCQAARRIPVREALQCFRPRVVVLGSRFPEPQRRRWADSCRRYGIPVHDVSARGAWTLEAGP